MAPTGTTRQSRCQITHDVLLQLYNNWRSLIMPKLVTLMMCCGCAICRQLRFVHASAADLKPTARDGTLDLQASRLDGKRLQEEDRLQRRGSRGHCAPCSTCELQIARPREDDAGVHDVIRHEGVHGASDRRAQQSCATRRRHVQLSKWVWRHPPQEGTPSVPERRH